MTMREFKFLLCLIFLLLFLTILVFWEDAALRRNSFFHQHFMFYSSSADSISNDDLRFKWTEFTANQTLLNNSCGYNLNMQAWNPNSSAKICLLPENLDIHVSGSIKRDGNWEGHLQIELFPRYFSIYPKAAFIDVGAQLGVYSISALKLGRKVVAFEPNRVTQAYLKHSIFINNLTENWTLLPVAVGDQPGKCVETFLEEEQKANNGGTKVSPGVDCSSVSAVPSTTLDQLIPMFKALDITQAIMKVDIEGYEPKAILGAHQFLREIDVPVIQMEFFQMTAALKAGKPSSSDPDVAQIKSMMQLLEDLKYSAHSVDGKYNLHTSFAEKWPVDVMWTKKFKFS